MPTYSARCTKCGHEQDYVARIADMDKTPKCAICKKKTKRFLTAPMVGAMGLADHAAFRSTIDGTMVYGKSGLEQHMKKYGVVHESDIKGEAQHQRKQIEAKEKKERKETIQKVVQQIGS